MKIGPDSTTTTYFIDYAQAVSALDKIGAGISKYNTVVRQAKKEQDDLKKSTHSLQEGLEAWNAGLAKIKESNNTWIQGLKKLESQMKINIKVQQEEILSVKEFSDVYGVELRKMTHAVDAWEKSTVSFKTGTSNLARLGTVAKSVTRDIGAMTHAANTGIGKIVSFTNSFKSLLGTPISALGTQASSINFDTNGLRNAVGNALGGSGPPRIPTPPTLNEPPRDDRDLDMLIRKHRRLLSDFHATDEAAKNLTKSNEHLTGSWVAMRIAIGSLISRGISALITNLSQVGGQTIELSKRISELQTITIDTSDGILKTAKSTAEWKGELQSLSRAFGIPTLQTTEALYQALSNQVVGAGNATSFMAEEMKLAITAVSSLDQAVSVTSTVINAYHKETSEAARINAVLFKAVDLGRFRLEELGSGFGKTAILAHDLGISFEEQAGSLALLTRLGLNADTAQTFLVNVLTHLTKPTKEMTELFDKWGVTSGAAAVNTFGFSNVIKKLGEETAKGGDQMKELATTFQDVRAIIGAQGLVSNFDQLQDTINKVSDATKLYNKAFELSLDATGRKAEIELEKLRQQFLNTFGEQLVHQGLNIAKFFGGADKALDALMKTVRIAIEAWVGYKVVLIATELAQSRFNISIVKGAGFLTNASVVTNSVTTALFGMAAAEAAATAGLTLLAVGIGELIADAATMSQRLESSFNVLRSKNLEEGRKILESITSDIDDFARMVEKSNNSVFRTYARFAASIRAVNTALVEDFEKNFIKMNKAMVKGLNIDTDVLEKRLKSIDAFIKVAAKNLEDMNKRAIKVKEELEEKGFEAGLVGVSPEEAISRTIARKRSLDTDALAALKRGEIDLSDELFRRSERLMKDAESRIEAFRKRIVASAEEIRTRISSTGARSVTTDDGTDRITAFRTAPGRPRISRSLPGVGAITRTASRSGISVTHKEVIVDTERIAALERTLLDLRLESERVEGRKLVAIKEGIALTEKIKAAEEKKRDVLAANLETFKKTVAAIDAFDIKKTGAGAIKEFSGLLSSAEAAGKAAGLTPAEQFQFLRQAAAQKILLERQTAVKIQEDALNAVKTGLDKAKALKEAADKDFINKAKTSADQTIALQTQNAEVSARLRSEFVRPGFGTGRLLTRTPESEEAKNNILASLDKFDRLNQDLLNLQKTGGDTSTVLGQIADQQKRINEQIVEFSKLHGVKRNTTTPIPKKDARGIIVDEKGNPINAGIEASADALAKLRANLDAAALAKKNFEDAQAAMTKLQVQVNLLPKEFRDMGDAAEAAGKKTLTAAQAINEVYRTTLATLLAIQKAQEDIMRLKIAEEKARADAGPIVPRAFGGYGTDRGLVAIGSGEMIMNRLATRQYAPLLSALNHTFPGHGSGRGGDSVSVGDISIQTHSSTTTGQALEMGRQLQRLIKQGLLSLN